MSDFLHGLDIDYKYIEDRIEKNIKKRGRNTDHLKQISKSFDCEENLYLTQDINLLIKKLESKSNIRTIYPLISYDKKYNKILFFIRRVIRKSIAWYINPIIKEQNELNKITIEIIKQLTIKIENLESKK